MVFMGVNMKKVINLICITICIMSIIFIIMLMHLEIHQSFVSVIEPNQPSTVNGAIVTIIRSTNKSMFLTINMIHSILQFYPYSHNFPYPLIIFHDEHFNSVIQEQILSCVLQTQKQMQISFAFINFTTSIKPSNESRSDKPMGYRLMCRFWIYDVFYHPIIKQGNYEYLMRMDDDSYFSDTFSNDPFLYMHNQKLDYLYRSRYREPITSVKPILRRFTKDNLDTVGCIYNNFFVIRLQWFYQMEEIQNFIHELVKDDFILREYIGDGCVHAAMLLIDKKAKSEHIINIPYGHNVHFMAMNHRSWRFHASNAFLEEIDKSCKQLTVLRGRQGTLTRIKVAS